MESMSNSEKSRTWLGMAMVKAALLLSLPLVALDSPAFSAEPAPRCQDVASIGVATMAADGTITLRITSLPPGPVAHGNFTYAPSHAQYEEIKRHIGGITPGEQKPVPPWCD